jgi:hypothetical protein
MSCARRTGVDIDSKYVLPFVSPLAESHPDQAVLLLARLRLNKIAVPRHAYLDALIAMTKIPGFKFSATRVQSVVKMMAADSAHVSSGDVVCEMLGRAPKLDDVKAIYAMADQERLADDHVLDHVVEAYLRVTDGRPAVTQRHDAWWILKTLRTCTHQKIYVSAQAHVALLQRLIALRFRAAATIQFQNLRAHPDYAAHVTAPLLLSLLPLCSQRSVRAPVDGDMVASDSRMFHGAGMAADTRLFMHSIWDELERLHNTLYRSSTRNAKLNPSGAGSDGDVVRSTYPSEAAHRILLDTCSAIGDKQAMAFAYKLMQDRYPACARGDDVLVSLVEGAARAGDPGATLVYSKLRGVFDVRAAKALLHSIYTLDTYHYFATAIADIQRHQEVVLDIKAELQLACHRIAHAELTPDRLYVAIPIPALHAAYKGGDTRSTTTLGPFKRSTHCIVGIRRNNIPHFIITAYDHINNTVSSPFGSCNEMYELITQFEGSKQGPQTCAQFNCLTHGHVLVAAKDTDGGR